MIISLSVTVIGYLILHPFPSVCLIPFEMNDEYMIRRTIIIINHDERFQTEYQIHKGRDLIPLDQVPFQYAELSLCYSITEVFTDSLGNCIGWRDETHLMHENDEVNTDKFVSHINVTTFNSST
jgi:hypothetical protein